VLTALGEKATTTALNLKAPLASPALTGTATAANLTVATNLLIGATNVLTTLNLKANTTDTYTRTQVANLFQPLITTFGSPLRCDVNILSGLSTLSIEETAVLTIGDINSSGVLSVDTIEVKNSDHIQVNNNFTINGNLVVEGFNDARPYASLRVITSTAAPAVASTGTNAGSIGTPGVVALTQLGYLTTVSLLRGQPGTTNLFSYLFTMPFVHPQGSNYIVNGGFYSSGALSASPNAVLTFSVTSSTTFNVYVRSPTNILMDGNFYVYTVP
jgi:hypothetical protein